VPETVSRPFPRDRGFEHGIFPSSGNGLVLRRRQPGSAAQAIVSVLALGNTDPLFRSGAVRSHVCHEHTVARPSRTLVSNVVYGQGLMFVPAVHGECGVKFPPAPPPVP